MWYSKTHNVGIYRKKTEKRPKKQVFQLGGKKSSLSEGALMELGKECLQKLEGGMAVGAVKKWGVKNAK
jgi:hypothetical protein